MRSDSGRTFAIALVALLFGAGIGAWAATSMEAPAETLVDPIQLREDPEGADDPGRDAPGKRSDDHERGDGKKEKKATRERPGKAGARSSGGGRSAPEGGSTDDADPAPAPAPVPAGRDEDDDDGSEDGDDDGGDDSADVDSGAGGDDTDGGTDDGDD